MQKAIENFINIQSKNMVSIEDIDDVINKIRKKEIEREWKRRLIQWRKMNK